jgi:hypothetical protein
VIRRGNVAIYRRDHLQFNHRHFEVVVIRASKPYPEDPNCESYDRVEIYPSSLAWGKFGFTYRTENEAIRKMDAILTSADASPLTEVEDCGAFVELGG